MNTRINKLFGKALDAAVPYTWDSLDHAEVEKVMKVLAELIMRECVEHLESSVLVPNIEGSRTKTKCIRTIKEHFGVIQWNNTPV